MRRLLAAIVAASILTATCATARQAVVLPKEKENYNPVSGGPGLTQFYQNLTLEILTALINHSNYGGVDFYTPEQAPTTLAASGMIGGKSYNGVVWPGWRMSASVANTGAMGCYPCSLTTWRIAPDPNYAPTKPQWFIDCGQAETVFSTSASCSTGFNGETGDPAHQAPGYGGGRINLMGTPYVWGMPQGVSMPIPGWKSNTGQTQADTTNDATGVIPSGGYRVLIGGYGSNWCNYPLSAGTPPAWRDSLYYNSLTFARLNYGSLGHYVWYFPFGSYGHFLSESMNRDYSPSAPILWSYWQSSAVNSNGPTAAKDQRTNGGDPGLFLCGAAAYDSLVGRDLLGTNWTPYRQAIHISGVASRGGQFLGGGISPADSTVEKAYIDSLWALGVPVTASVRCDSIQTYASEINYMKSRGFKFAVERYNGTALTDSAALALLTAQVGANRVDRTLFGNMHNFTLVEFGNVPGNKLPLVVASTDSVAWLLYRQGFRALAFDAELDSAMTTSDVPYWSSGQRTIPINLGGAPSAQWLTVLAYPGRNPRGATMGNGRDSMEATFGTAHRMPNDSTFITGMYQRHMYGMILSHWLPALDRGRIFNTGYSTGTLTKTQTIFPWFGEPNITGTISPRANCNTGTNIISISASSLGSGGWGAASPNAPGWYEVKYTVNACRAAGVLAGRNMVNFVYPDQIGPQDIRR